ncbi:hypothetical protein EVAR_96864_1 [Eumeta japonica]|uniref:Uncharacterized protein n=1 Tax=Eumeta variegata TaxID=151549 RepID=A0A4C1WNW6_EUMVA|nr:hypothetical protein EVAR_96864_1 [Eumeta japonica]
MQKKVNRLTDISTHNPNCWKLQQMLGAGIAAGLVRPLSRAALSAREAPRALRLLAADHRCGRVLLSPEVGRAQLK